MERTEKQIALIVKALSDENRVRILKFLHNGEICACKLPDTVVETLRPVPVLAGYRLIYRKQEITTAEKATKRFRKPSA